MNIQDIKRLATEGKSPHFFSPDTMRFFNSKVYNHIRKVEKGFLFITSEVFGDEPRHYAIRFINLEGSIDTLKEYQSLSQAKKHLKDF